MTIVVLVRKRGNLSTIARCPEKRYQNAATEPTTPFLKGDDVLNGIEVLKYSDLLPTAMAAHKALQLAIMPLCASRQKIF